MENKLIYLKFLDKDEEWQGAHYINPNAYPKDLEYLVSSSWKRFILALTYYNNLDSILKKDILNFLAVLNRKIAQLQFGDKKISYEVSYEGIDYVSNVYMIFIMTKSFLDLWAQVAAKLIDPASRIIGFRGSMKGKRKLAGEKFIRWLQNIDQQTENVRNFTSLILCHRERWINIAVGYRDNILHFGEIKDMKPLRIIIKEMPKTSYKEDDLILPSMPNNSLTGDFCREILSNLSIFVIESIKLLPNVNLDYLDLTPLVFAGSPE